MRLNHIKTWPVSTMAVVQLRVNLEQEVQDFYVNNIPSSDYDEVIRPHVSNQNEDRRQSGPVLPLSRKHLEIFTKMSSHPHKTVRTDTVSTILEQDEFDSELQSSTSDDTTTDRYEKFHVLALARMKMTSDTPENCNSVGRRPSNKVDNWDLIYTGSSRKQIYKKLDNIKTTLLSRRWLGWIIIVCAVLLNVINHGLQLSCSQLTRPAAEKFRVHTSDFAGKSFMHFTFEFTNRF
ncbi:hypothetical protein RI129_000096 [Pyrocoelia pectoralis]|uniref:Uncharacterized protein n=1 Tax=Pyrocoelia pectoralis TaxID=417401 RepID=A0AAN7V2U7_9COLE